MLETIQKLTNEFKLGKISKADYLLEMDEILEI